VVYFTAPSIIHYAGISSRKSFRPIFEFHKSAYLFFCKYSTARNIKAIRLAVFFALSSRFYAVLARECFLRFHKSEKAISAETENIRCSNAGFSRLITIEKDNLKN
jgi:GT2 family glycosyltransferase